MIVACLPLVAAAMSPEIRVDGAGYFRLMDRGRIVYAPSVRLEVHEGWVSDRSGLRLVPHLQVLEPGELNVEPDGTIYLKTKTSDRRLGRLMLAVFPLSTPPEKEGSFWVSGLRPTTSYPTVSGAGSIVGSVRPPVKSKGAVSGTITVNPSSVTEKDTFSIGDIATVIGPEPWCSKTKAVIIGETPPAGVERIIDPVRIQAKLIAAGLDNPSLKLDVPRRSKVARGIQVITAIEIVATATEAAKAILEHPAQLESTTQVPELRLGKGRLELMATDVKAGAGNLIKVTVEAYLDGVRRSEVVVVLKRSTVGPKMRVGDKVTVRMISGSIRMDLDGKLTRVPDAFGIAEVKLDSGATMTGRVTQDGFIEVNE